MGYFDDFVDRPYFPRHFYNGPTWSRQEMWDRMKVTLEALLKEGVIKEFKMENRRYEIDGILAVYPKRQYRALPEPNEKSPPSRYPSTMSFKDFVTQYVTTNK